MYASISALTIEMHNDDIYPTAAGFIMQVEPLAQAVRDLCLHFQPAERTYGRMQEQRQPEWVLCLNVYL